MNKVLFITKNIITLICLVLLVYFINLGLYIPGRFDILFMYIIIFLMLISVVEDVYKKDKHIKYNKKYNIISIIGNSVVLLVLLRGLFDTNIIVNVFNDVFSMATGVTNTGKTLFVANNLIYINIIYTCLILYRITLIERIGFGVKDANRRENKGRTH